MNQRNEMIWMAALNSITNEFEPMRSARRNTTSENSFFDRNLCQQECDKRNSGYERPSPLVLIPDRTPIFNPLT
jgi:hypothetical protein